MIGIFLPEAIACYTLNCVCVCDPCSIPPPLANVSAVKTFCLSRNTNTKFVEKEGNWQNFFSASPVFFYTVNKINFLYMHFSWVLVFQLGMHMYEPMNVSVCVCVPACVGRGREHFRFLSGSFELVAISCRCL